MDTPLEMLSNIFGLGLPTYTYQSHRERVLYTFTNLQKIPELAGPKIVFAHILSPHPPFVFDEQGNFIEPDLPYQLFDGTNTPEQKDAYVSGYRAQVEFVNAQVLKTVDAILENSRIPPVIILLGDHGPGSMFKSDMQDPGCLWERTGNLNALLLPNHLTDPQLYPELSPVNDLRLVLNLYFQANLSMLEDKTFLTSDQDPYAIKDITTQTRASQACTAQDAVLKP
jgi:hypothetical protein